MALTAEQVNLICGVISAVGSLSAILQIIVGDAPPRVKGATILLLLIILSVALTYFLGLQPTLQGALGTGARFVSWAAFAIALLLVVRLVWWLIKMVVFHTLSTRWSPPHRLLHYVASRVYGMEYAQMRLTVTIDQHGEATYRRDVELVAHSAFSEIRHYIFQPFENLQPGDKLPMVQHAKGEWRNVTLALNRAYGYQRVNILHFDPALSRGKKVRYSCEDYPPRDTFAIEESDRERKEHDEYAVFDITVPTKRLIVEVQFPAGFNPQELRPAVWYAVDRSQYAHEREYQRVCKVFKGPVESGGRRIARLDVRAPALGLTYGFRWDPPKWVKFADENPRAI